jgi:hypothetical protein
MATDPDPLMNLTEVDDRINAASADVKDELHDYVWKLLAAQDALEARVDARATMLFGAIGFSMTLAFSFGGWNLLEKAHQVPLGKWIAGLFFVALCVGLLACWLALQALLIKKTFAFPREDSVLRELQDKERFRTNLVMHLWQVWQRRHVRTEDKATRVTYSQVAFVWFLGGILVLSGFTTCSAIENQGVVAKQPVVYCSPQTKDSDMANTPKPAQPAAPAPVQEPVRRPPAPREVGGENQGPRPVMDPGRRTGQGS